jgi:uncharacterized protein YgiM (DUF1202 family)
MKRFRLITGVAMTGALTFGLVVVSPHATASETLQAITAVNVRSGPSTDYTIIGLVGWGYTVEATGPSVDGWTPVNYNGQAAYVSSQYFVVPGEQPTADGPTGDAWMTAYVNVRNGPSTSHTRLDTLPTGAKVTLTGRVSNGYSQIIWYGGAKAWVISSWLDNYVTPATPEPAPAATASELPTALPTVGSVSQPRVDAVAPTASAPTASETAAPEAPAAEAADPATEPTAEPATESTAEPATEAAAEPSAEPTVEPSPVTVGPVAEPDPSLADRANAAGPAEPTAAPEPAATSTPEPSATPEPAAAEPSDEPTTDEPTTDEPTTDEEPAAEEPTAGEPELPATTTTVVAQKLAASDLNLRGASTATSEILAVIPSGTVLDVVGEEVNGRLPVTYQGKTGWVSKDYVTDVPTTAGPAVPAAPTVTGVMYATDTLNVRSEPNTTSSVVGTLVNTQKVETTGVTDGVWVQISYQGAARWVSGDYLTTEAPPPLPEASTRAEAIVNFVKSKVGLAYIWGGTGPDGYDCSGLAYSAYASIGVTLPRTADAQAGVGTPVDLANIQPGDLVFYYNPISHVAIYVGDGQVVHASTYGVGVVYGDVGMTTITAIRRIL